MIFKQINIRYAIITVIINDKSYTKNFNLYLMTDQMPM